MMILEPDVSTFGARLFEPQPIERGHLRRLGPEKLNDEQRRDLLEIIEDRYEKRSTIFTSQVPVDHWYDMIGNPTLADGGSFDGGH